MTPARPFALRFGSRRPGALQNGAATYSLRMLGRRAPLAILTAALAAALASPTGANAAALRATGTWRAKVAAVEGHASVPGPAGPEINIVHGDCPGEPNADGCADLPDSVIYLVGWDHYGFAIDGFNPGELEHELGHFFEDRNLDDAEKHHMQALVGMPHKGWSDCGNPLDEAYGHCPLEFVADAYADCALSGRTFSQDTGYGWHPTRRQFRRVCRAFWRYADAN